ncbi:membrane integrity-associated transporter subunit PqiC [Halomonas sp. ISL-56]|uniref:ABC-type transport auxiliary lipoprotein family protein n=1 Tax=Halomonas sp. ISL-56 TaxID=2819149 RepID=UPI001BE59E1B|nr:ABC-type transport auxiliary lipoprotein family protein [Halomonas sp. ISL-56]MBT2800070.1 membrane integrity-associated transporter subunit PqiC [Halomonas sp. ISL-56]
MSFRPAFIILISAALLFSAGCSILPESEPATLYRLPASDLPSAVITSNSTSQRLGIANPEAGHLLHSNRIVVYPERNVVNVYEGARWHEDAPNLIKARLIAGIQQSQLFAGVGSDRLPHDLLLLSELRHFQSDYVTNPPTVKVQLDVQLVSPQNRMPLAANNFSTSAQAKSVDITDVVDAFGSASDELTEQLAAWLAQQTDVIER